MRCAWSVVGIFFTMENIEEIWKDIPNYEGLYQVSNLGNVKSLNYNRTKKEKTLKISINRNGYCMVGLYKNRNIEQRTVHSLVGQCFLNYKPKRDGFVINHKNFIRHDNTLENLEVVTHRENCNKKHLKSSSKYVGVYYSKKRKKFISQIFFNNKLILLGSFKEELEASEYYNNALISIQNNEKIKTKPLNKISKYKGVTYHKKSNKWQSQIVIKNKIKYLGLFNTQLEAYNEYKKQLKQNHYEKI